jgi:DNA gyrase inhibitor GyrI
MAGISAAVDEAFPELFGWLAEQGIAPVGPPFIRYLVIDMAAELEIELAVPVSAPIARSGRVQPGVLPEGSYAVLRHTGPYDGLVAANAALQQCERARCRARLRADRLRDGVAQQGRALCNQPGN